MVAPKKSSVKKVAKKSSGNDVPKKASQSGKEYVYDYLIDDIRRTNIKIAKVNKKINKLASEHNRLVDFLSKHFYLESSLRVSLDDLELLQEKSGE